MTKEPNRKAFLIGEFFPSEVKKMCEKGWLPLHRVQMAPPEYFDDDLRTVAEAARAVA